MKRINLRLDKNVFNKLENYTKSNDISINQLMNYIIAHYFSDSLEFKQYLPKGRERKIEKRIRLTISEYELLNQFASANNHRINDEILFRLIGTFTKEPIITKTELSTMKSFTNAFTRIGNNINQIAKLMNSDDENRFNISESLKKDIADINVLIKAQRYLSDDFMKKASKRWHYELKEK